MGMATPICTFEDSLLERLLQYYVSSGIKSWGQARGVRYRHGPLGGHAAGCWTFLWMWYVVCWYLMKLFILINSEIVGSITCWRHQRTLCFWLRAIWFVKEKCILCKRGGQALSQYTAVAQKRRISCEMPKHGLFRRSLRILPTWISGWHRLLGGWIVISRYQRKLESNLPS